MTSNRRDNDSYVNRRKVAILSVALLLIMISILVSFNLLLGWPAKTNAKDHQVNNNKKKIAPADNLKVAFISDQDINENSKNVLRLIKGEGASMIINAGDLNYQGDTKGWEKSINEILGDDYPYFIVRGNHDYRKWSDYQISFKKRLEKIEGVSYEGDLGVKSVITYKGIRLIFLGGMRSSLQKEYEKYLSRQLTSDNDYIWEIVAWHKNQRLLQVGDKKDEASYDLYDIAREEGAIIATGHNHLYARTKLMASFKDQQVESESNTLTIDKGYTFAFTNGLGGKSIDTQDTDLADNPWWAAIYSKDQGANYGALFITFSPAGQTNSATGYFKDIDGKIIDEFTLIKK